MFQVLSKAEMEMKRSSLPQILFEMAVLRLTDVRPMQEIDALIDKINRMEGPSPAKTSAPLPTRGESSSARRAAPEPAQPAPKRNEPVDPPDLTPSAPSSTAENKTWDQVRSAAVAIKRPLGTYLDNCQLTSLNDNEICLNFPDPFTMGQVEKDENFAALKEAVTQVYGKPDIKIILKLGKTSSAPVEETVSEPASPKARASGKKASASEDEIMRDALDVFGGKVIG
jgi:DNA polymerase III gamma/tau subunit